MRVFVRTAALLTVVGFVLGLGLVGCKTKETKTPGKQAQTVKPAPEPPAQPGPGTEAVESKAAPTEGAPKAAADTKVAAPTTADTEEKAAVAPVKDDKHLGRDQLRAKMRHFSKLGIEKTPESRKELLATVNNSEQPVQLRIGALKALTRNAQAEDQEMFRELLGTLQKGVPLHSEAAVGLYRAGDTKAALPLLKESAKAGHSVSQAFFLGFVDGRRKYAPEAKAVFLAALESESPYAKIKAASDLLHMGEKKEAFKVFKQVSKDRRLSVRMALLNYLQPHLRTVGDVKKLVKTLTGDSNEKIKARAKRILERAAKTPSPKVKKPAGKKPAGKTPAAGK